jgi:hypothetical protein
MTEQEKAELDVEKIASFWLVEAEEALQVADHLICIIYCDLLDLPA